MHLINQVINKLKYKNRITIVLYSLNNKIKYNNKTNSKKNKNYCCFRKRFQKIKKEKDSQYNLNYKMKNNCFLKWIQLNFKKL